MPFSSSLVWESTVLLALCSDEALPPGCQFGRADLEKLLPPEFKSLADAGAAVAASTTQSSSLTGSAPGASSLAEAGTNSVAAALQALSTEPSPPAAMEVDSDQPPPPPPPQQPSPPQLQQQVQLRLGSSSTNDTFETVLG